MRRITYWTLAVLLVLAMCGVLEAVRRALAHQSQDLNKTVKESMVGGLNVTSDDLAGYAESNAYSDTSDSKIYGDISWKIKNCSTITQADLNRAVNEAVVKTKASCMS